MSQGLVYLWRPDAARPLGGRVEKGLVDLGHLDVNADGRPHLRNELVEVRNGGRRYRLNPSSGAFEDTAIGNAKPDGNGDFCFEAGKGGGRLDKHPYAPEDFQQRYVQAAHFGEVNTFYHLHKISAYINRLLRDLGEPSLPPVVAVVNAHHAATTTGGVKDGLHREDRCLAFQGGHYRLPCKRNTVVEHHAIAVDGEIHLGPGRQLLGGGALVELSGCSYRANASHNAGIIYHEYGHHITRHTADFMANCLRKPHRQDNRKAAIDEGLCDYWTAAMLETPHIWAFHKRHDAEHRHPRSLASSKTMDDFDPADEADPHLNGTIWSAALWDLRCEMQRREASGATMTDRMVLKALTLISADCTAGSDIKLARLQRSDYSGGLAKLLKADAILFDGRFGELIVETFARRKIFVAQQASSERAVDTPTIALPESLRRLPAEDIPSSQHILSAANLARQLDERGVAEYSVICTGDIMLGDRTRRSIELFGEDYPFAGVLPLLRRSAIVCGNLEGPFAREADRQDRTYSYRVDPRLAHALKRANINVVTLANNHLVDCGRAGAIETFEALETAGVHMVGAGRNEPAAHEPVILDAGPLRVGILGYYWNRRCAATRDLPGSATDEVEWLTADIKSLRHRVDRIVTVFHWGVPYERTPHPDDQAKARLAVDLGADLVIGHHPHIIQPFEIYNGRPIFYSVGNFAFGSGNSKAEGLLVATHFGARETVCDIYPIYVKNRDPRVDYQPKALGGVAGRNILQRLAAMSGPSSEHLDLSGGIGRVSVQRSALEKTAR